MSDWLPSMNALRAFEATARHLSFAQAAAELHVTPAAVKQLVRKLEETLGLSLIERAGRGLRLTTAGAAGRDELTTGFDHLAGAVRRMRAEGGAGGLSFRPSRPLPPPGLCRGSSDSAFASPTWMC